MDSVQTFAMSSVFQDEKKIRLEIRDVIRQITASVVSSEFRGLLRAPFDRLSSVSFSESRGIGLL